MGVWFGVDVGTVRVGVARSDPGGTLAFPITTLARDRKRDTDVAELAALVAEYATDGVVEGVVLGLPRTLADREGPSAQLARGYGDLLAPRIAPIPVRYVDERLTTVSATRKLAQNGVRARAGRAVIDQAAAVELLQHWLEIRHREADEESDEQTSGSD